MRALFIAAHADDVEISAGGTIQVLIEDGWEVWTTATITPDRERLRESVDAAKILGATIMPYRGDIRELTSYWDGFDFDLIVTPSSTDSHPEHREAAELGVALTRKNDTALWEMNHAIPGGIYRMPQLNHFVEFPIYKSTVKSRAIRAYKSQILKYGPWWLSAINARDLYYGLMANRHDTPFYAEGFHIVHS